ncbi:hypothetical protein AHAS_Ahas09G0131500 [Arachis hypogaea]
MDHIHQILYLVIFIDPNSNYMDVRIQRGENKLYFIKRWLDLFIYYDQPNEMWVKLIVLGIVRFLVELNYFVFVFVFFFFNYFI